MNAKLTATALGCSLLFATALLAAVQDPNAPSLDFPVPREQRKIAAGSEAEFANGRLNVRLETFTIHRASAVVQGEKIELEANRPRLVTVGEQICTIVYFGKSGSKGIVAVGCAKASPELRAEAARQAAAAQNPADRVTPLDLVATTPKGELRNPYRGNPEAAEEGRKLFLAYSCNGCHGGTGGGGMGPPLTNGVWVYGSDDDTLFRLIALGSDGLQGLGYSRKGRENVVGPMPAFGELMDSADDLWKIVTFVQKVGGVE